MSDPMELGFVARATGGRLRHAGPGDRVRRICTDSRKVEEGDLFVALRGERFDAHDFLDASIGRRAAASLVDRPPGDGSLPHVLVDDTRRALGRLARAWRRRFGLPVVAITGSNGKTTTREFLRTLLSPLGKVAASPASFNNDVGVPLSLLQLDRESRAGVFEVGTNHPGEIRSLTRLVEPDFGILTFVGRSHLEHFGTVEAVAEEKAALGEELRPEGTLLVNGDIPLLDRVVSRVSARVVTVGTGESCDWRIRTWRHRRGGMDFELDSGEWGGERSFALNVLGEHHLINAALALAAAWRLGVEPGDLARLLEQCRGEPMRLEWKERAGVAILDDSYNANADSSIAALRTLSGVPARGSRYCVMGEMAELGEHSEVLHREVGRAAGDLGIDGLFSVGPWAGAVREAAAAGGVAVAEAHERWPEAAASLLDRLEEGDVVLVKGSRSARLDRLVDHLGRSLEGQEEGGPPGSPVRTADLIL